MLTLNPDNTRLFVTGGENNIVLECPLNTDGSITSCVSAGFESSFNQPYGISIDPTGTSAFIGNYGSPEISICTINPVDGTFSSCNNITTSFYAYGVTINSSLTYLYAANDGNNVFVCQLNQCVDSGFTFTGNETTSITLTQDGTTAFIGNFIFNYLTICTINQTDGTFSSCNNTADLFKYPTVIALSN